MTLPQLVQGRASLVDELLAAGLRGGERGGDLRVAQATQLAHHDRAALPIRERGEVGHERPDLLAGGLLTLGQVARSRVGEVGVGGLRQPGGDRQPALPPHVER